MLSALHVGNYVLIDSLDIRFPEGLIIISGQTGAGKSILLGALSLVMGAKADASLIGEHGESCVVEAEFDVEDKPELRNFLEENDIEPDGGHLILRRTIAPSGRSRAFVNDSPVPASLLQELSLGLIDIHSQHQTRLLSDKAFQLDILDHYAGNETLRKDTARSWNRLISLRKERETLVEKRRKAADEQDYNEAMFRQLDEARLRSGELGELEAEQEQLSHAEEIKQELTAVEGLLSPEDDRLVPVDVALKESVRHLSRLSRFIPSLGPLSARLESARLELDDIVSEVAQVNARTDVSEERLQAVEDRLSLLYGLMKRHRADSVEDLIAKRDSLSELLFDNSELDARIEAMDKEIKAEGKAYAALSDRLHASREAAAPAFAGAVLDSLRFLELEQAVFAAELSEAEPGAGGRDRITFLFSASGKNPVDVAKCASGGEMSRIMLSLKAMMARYTEMPTLVFDEIDTGVSGSAADKMGSMICAMGEDMQVFAITHLPQVAAKGKAHYLVTKEDSVTSIRLLDSEGRLMEVARMLSGSRITEAAIENARTLLS
ncbi:MAG: DNA repair protein RecN [Bacteroidales bacterium]|nr:DNA repair protein RecN [Bacteroidales bacterium]